MVRSVQSQMCLVREFQRVGAAMEKDWPSKTCLGRSLVLSLVRLKVVCGFDKGFRTNDDEV